LAKHVLHLRNALIECNLPLAISRARMFYARNRSSHHTYMDMLQVASGGLAAGVDKYVGPYTTGFRAVLIGRILGDLIEANSETFVHFFPPDKRRLYRIRKIATTLREGLNNVDYEHLAKLLNKEEKDKGEPLTKVGDLHHLVNASSVVQASTLPLGEDEEEHGSPMDRYADVGENRPDMLLEEAQSRTVVARAISDLPIIDQKLLRLRGVDTSSLTG
jgi:DNA-directed RNA polymerase specialized sigma subunit